jgi:Uma2 family endonuclease
MTVAIVRNQIVVPQPLLLNVTNTTLTVTSEQFDRLCIDNPDLRLELTPDLNLIVMAPTGGEVFDSSTGYDLTKFGGGKPSPDVSWIEKSRLEGANIVGFIPVVPDFVIELLSATDSLSETKSKMEKYQRVGVKLGLLINPKHKQVFLYRLAQEVEILESPSSIDCGEVMPDFRLDLSKIW